MVEGAALVPNKAVRWLSLAEGAALEMRYAPKGIVGSNPTLTALHGIAICDSDTISETNREKCDIPQKGIVSSNLTPTASKLKYCSD